MANIYISSDPREFGSYREVLRERLRDHGHKARTRDELEEGGKPASLQRIDEAISKSDAILCLMGERYGAEPSEKEREARSGERHSFTQWEYLLAKQHEKPVHVFYADDVAPLDTPNDEGKDLTKLQETFLAQEIVSKGIACKAFKDKADLIEQVRQLEASWPRGKEVTLQNPYVGMRRFEEKDRERFFGRESLVQSILSRLETQRLTALVGQSGSGKSSLVRASVIPAWRAKNPEGKVIVFQPDRDPFASLKGALTLAGFDAIRVQIAGDPSETVFRSLRRGSVRANDPLGLKGGTKPATEPWLVFVDQFEEICTRPGQSLDDQECIRRFVASLEDAAGMEDSGITILVALRDSFFGCLHSHPGLYPLIDSQLIRIATPDSRELRTIIEAPARANGVRLEEGLLSTLLADWEESGGSLPILADTLAHLWETEAESGLEAGLIRSETYRKIGGVQDALPGRMARYMEGKAPEEQRVVQNILLALVGIHDFGGSIHSFSRPLPQSEVLEKGGRGSQEILRELISPMKVILASEVNPFDPMVELAHEALIQGWNTLDRWVAESREALELRRQMAHSAKAWEKLRSDSKSGSREIKAVLWRGGRLTRALECNRVDASAKQSEFERIGGLDLLEQDFLKASEQKETRSARLRRRVAIAVCVAVLGSSGSWVFVERQSLAVREQMRNTALETKLSKSQTEAALGWLMRAKTFRASTDSAFYAARVLGFEGTGRPENAPSAGGKFTQLLPTDPWGQARTEEAKRLIREAPLPFVWSSPSQAAPAAGDRGSTGAAVAWSPDGKWFASGGPGSVVVLWNAAGGEVAKKLEGHEGPVTCLAFSPDGTLLASGGADKTVRLWKLASGESTKLTGHTGWVGALAFRPDGARLASGGYDETVRIWDLSKGTEVKALSGEIGFVYGVAFSPDGSLLAAGGENEGARIWDADSGTLRHALKGHARSVNGVAFSPDGHLLATASSDQTIKIWEVSTWAEKATLAGHAGGAASLAWASGGEWLASSGVDRTIRIWNIEKRKEEAVLTGHGTEVTSLAWDPANTHLLTGGKAGDVKLWMARRPTGETGPPRDLLRYVESGWAQFDPDSGDLTWKQLPDGLAYQQALIDAQSWIGILSSGEDEKQKTLRLYQAALAARDWNAAKLLAADVPPEQRQEPSELAHAAARALVAEVKRATTTGFARLRIEQGRALLASDDAWKEFDKDPALPVDALVATIIKPPKVEPVKPEPTLVANALGQPGSPGGTPAPDAQTPVSGAEMPATGAENPPGGAIRAQVIAPGSAEEQPSTEPTVHIVQAGDNPFVVAKKYGITMDELVSFNKIKDPRRIQIGTELKIPPSKPKPAAEETPKSDPEPEDPSFTYHTVKAGENPNFIAKKYHVAEWELMKLNEIDNPSKLQIGTRLKIPKTTLKAPQQKPKRRG